MKSVLTIIGLMFFLLLAFSVSGRQITPQQIILQDDKTGDHLEFNLSTGEYKFESCNTKNAINGTGRVAISGCRVVFKDLTETRRVLAEVDLCAHSGKADVAFSGNAFRTQTDTSVVEFVISDTQTTNSTFSCDLKQ
jgi:hypothetical protein